MRVKVCCFQLTVCPRIDVWVNRGFCHYKGGQQLIRKKGAPWGARGDKEVAESQLIAVDMLHSGHT